MIHAQQVKSDGDQLFKHTNTHCYCGAIAASSSIRGVVGSDVVRTKAAAVVGHEKVAMCFFRSP